MNRIIFVILTTLCLGACAPKHNDYSRFADVDPEGWAYGDTVRFRPADLDSVAPRRISVAVRHNNDYQFANLWIEVTWREGNRYWRDTVNMELADRFGRWTGTGIGPSVQNSVTVCRGLNISDSSDVEIRHVMRVDTLRGIEQIGITIDTPQ